MKRFVTGNISIGHKGFLNFGKNIYYHTTNKIDDSPFIKFLRDIARIKPMHDFLKTIESPDQTVKECWENKIKKIEKGEIDYAALWAEAEDDVKEGGMKIEPNTNVKNQEREKQI